MYCIKVKDSSLLEALAHIKCRCSWIEKFAESIYLKREPPGLKVDFKAILTIIPIMFLLFEVLLRNCKIRTNLDKIYIQKKPI